MTLILLPTTILPLTLIVGATLITLFGGTYITPKPDLSAWGLRWATVPVQNYFWLALAFFLLMGHWITHYGGRFTSPKIYAKQRGKQIAGYPWRELLVLPMVTLVPGDWIISHWAFWPVFSWQGHQFAILVLPLILGLRFTVFRQAPQRGLSRFRPPINLVSFSGNHRDRVELLATSGCGLGHNNSISWLCGCVMAS
ncbi:hypothetical protein L3X07_08265 [Levilactobacillus brevis]|nr:hypothetical protein [Levilactobacillus brevis]